MHITTRFTNLSLLKVPNMKDSTFSLILFYSIMFVMFSIQLKNCISKVINPSIFQKTTQYIVDDLETPAVTFCRKGPFKDNMTVAQLYEEPCNATLECFQNTIFDEYSDFFDSVTLMDGFFASSRKIDYHQSLYSLLSHTTLNCVTLIAKNRINPGGWVYHPKHIHHDCSVCSTLTWCCRSFKWFWN